MVHLISLLYTAGNMACFTYVCFAGMEEANGHANGAFNFERDIDSYIPVEVTETRLTGESQCLGAIHIQQPSAVACTVS